MVAKVVTMVTVATRVVAEVDWLLSTSGHENWRILVVMLELLRMLRERTTGSQGLQNIAAMGQVLTTRGLLPHKGNNQNAGYCTAIQHSNRACHVPDRDWLISNLIRI